MELFPFLLGPVVWDGKKVVVFSYIIMECFLFLGPLTFLIFLSTASSGAATVLLPLNSSISIKSGGSVYRHVLNTADIGCLAITNLHSVAQRTKRVTAITGQMAKKVQWSMPIPASTVPVILQKDQPLLTVETKVTMDFVIWYCSVWTKVRSWEKLCCCWKVGLVPIRTKISGSHKQNI